MEAMWTRFHPLTLEVKKIAEEGSLGAPVILHADLSVDFDIDSKCNRRSLSGWVTNSRRIDKPQTHRILDPTLGGGALLDL
jgi:predicted dehydrogenase